jgi:hypothetical protein
MVFSFLRIKDTDQNRFRNPGAEAHIMEALEKEFLLDENSEE